MIEIVSATRLSESEFWNKAPLGISLRRFAEDTRLIARIAFDNCRHLSEVFNESIDAQEDSEVLVFINDDVWIDDEVFVDKAIEGLKLFDIVGVAGNRRRVENQPGWLFIDENLTRDNKENLSGGIAYGKFPFGEVSIYGVAPAECELVDGVFMAAKKYKLKDKRVRFDPRFDLYFYDLDFCRSVRKKGLRLGVWPISLTVQSKTPFGSQRWQADCRRYLAKWETPEKCPSSTQVPTGKAETSAPPILPAQFFRRMKQLFSHSQSSAHANVAVPNQLSRQQVDLQNECSSYQKLGNEYLGKGNLDDAAECYAHMLAVNPNNAAGFLNLGFVLKEQKNHRDAEYYLLHAVRMDPTIADAYYLLGDIAREQGNSSAAIEHFRKTLELKPDFEIAYGDLFRLLFQNGQNEDARKIIEQGLLLFPQYAELHCFLGNLYVCKKEFDKAVACYEEALLIQPDYVVACANLGNAHMEQGNIDNAADCYRRLITLEPDSAEADSGLLFALSILANCPPAQYLAEARRYGSKVLAQAQPYIRWTVQPAGGDVRPLRVGLVSGDFRNHPVGYFLESILAHLNPARIELVAYPTVPVEDALTARIKSSFVAWHPIAEMSDEAAARKIYDDGIHILMDLAGHTSHNRLPIFAWKPAPVQVSWLGFFASTGVPGMDYVLADPISVPEANRDQFSETIWYLPDTRLCFTPPAASARLVPTPPPAERNGFITFGCFQNVSKITGDVLTLWGKIFHALPQARLRLQSKQMYGTAAREHLLQRLDQAGITRQRVEIQEPMTREDYLAAHAEVDIILDTFPFPGGTTTCEALWMGVPTVTLAGNTMLARQGASLLTCAGMEGWVANTEEDYVALAVAYASDVKQLAQLRAELRQKVLASPLYDGSRFALNLEDALYGMWQHSNSLNPPTHHV